MKYTKLSPPFSLTLTAGLILRYGTQSQKLDAALILTNIADGFTTSRKQVIQAHIRLTRYLATRGIIGNIYKRI